MPPRRMYTVKCVSALYEPLSIYYAEVGHIRAKLIRGLVLQKLWLTSLHAQHELLELFAGPNESL